MKNYIRECIFRNRIYFRTELDFAEMPCKYIRIRNFPDCIYFKLGEPSESVGILSAFHVQHIFYAWRASGSAEQPEHRSFSMPEFKYGGLPGVLKFHAPSRPGTVINSAS